jgi:hypothetical protein
MVVDFRSRRLLSAGWALSLLVAIAPAGSHLSHYFPQESSAFHYNQQLLKNNNNLYKHI